MELEAQNKDPQRGMSGPEVGALQNTLMTIGYNIADREITTQFFGNTTYDALVDFQKKVKLVPNGIFDSKAAWLIDDDHEHPKKFIVIGQVFKANGDVFPNLTVKAFDKDLRSEQLLKTDSTKSEGEYSIFYHASDFTPLDKDRADLFLRVFDGTTLVATSAIIFNAAKVEVVNFTLGDARGLSEFERMAKEIFPLLNGLAHADLNGEDVSFLSGETGIDAAFLTLLAESARRNREANTVPQSAFYGLFRQGLPTALTELLQKEIPLLRAALETSSNQGMIPQLSATDLDQLAAKLQALKARLILQPGNPGEVSSLGDLLKTSQLTVDKQLIVADLQVQHGGSTDSFWHAVLDHPDLTPTDKTDVRFTLQAGALTTNHIPLVVALRSAAPSGLIVEPKQNGSLAPTPLSEDATALRPFAVKNVADWKAILQPPSVPPLGTPPTIPGATLQERIDNYAVALNAYMEKALPTPVIAGRVEKDTAGDSPFRQVREDLRTFFKNNQAYEFRKTPIDVYLSEGDKLTGVLNRTALVAELKNMQRLFNIAPRYGEIRSLRKDDLHSAFSMVKLGQRKFTEKYAALLGGADKALEAYRKAQQTHATALNFYLNHALASGQASPAVVGNGASKSLVKTLATASATPDLPALFGSLDLCECDQCQSVYSPAAYFVDILKFLGDGPVVRSQSPLQVLLGRRPDLEHIELTCDNTTTELPYVDLAREIMERAVAPREFDIAEGGDISSVLAALNAGTVPTSFRTVFTTNGYAFPEHGSVRADNVTNGQTTSWLILDTGWAFTVRYKGSTLGFTVGAWPQTSWTADELRANPEHVHNAAYAELRKAVYPWNQPLNLPVEEARVYLGHFGTKRTEVMETFFRGTPAAALTEKPIANEYLGLTQQEADIITGVITGGPTDPKNPVPTGAWDFWGLKQTGNDLPDPTEGTDWDVVLKRVSMFLQQSGLSYRDMLELLSSYFINPATATGRMLGVVSTDPNDAKTCNLSRLEIRVVDPQIPDANKKATLVAAWNRMHRFARLWQKLGWTMRDLDKTIVAFQPLNPAGKLDITADFLVQLSHVERLRKQFGMPVVSLLSFWASIDTGKYLDHFAEGQPPVPSLYAQLFNNKSASGQSLAEDPTTLTGKLSENKPAIVAALQITVDELALMLADANIVPDDVLSLVNLSRLYRHATFAKALNYSIRTYLSALKLISATPFTTTPGTISFTQQSEKILASGFSIEDLNYLLRHDFAAGSNVAISDDVIAVLLNAIREEVRKVTADNSFVDASTDATAATSDPNGDLTKRKLALLNWDISVVEQLVAVLNNTFTHETRLDVLRPDIAFPEDLKGRLSYDKVAQQLLFTGVMTSTERDQLKALKNADAPFISGVQALFDAPTKMIKRHMDRFAVPRFARPLASFPNTINIPSALKSKAYYDKAAAELNFVGIMTDAEREALIDAEPHDPSAPPTAYAQAVGALFIAPTNTPPAGRDIFLTSAEVDALLAAGSTPATRFLAVLKKLLPYLRDTLSRHVVIQRVGEYLQLDARAANDLLTMWVISPAHPAQKAIFEFLAPAFAESNTNVEVSRDAFADQFKTFTLLYKIALLSLKFRASAEQMRWLFEFVPSNGWLDLNTLPLSTTGAAHPLYQGWARLADLFDLRDALPLGETLLTDIFTSARDVNTPPDALLDKISKGTGWKLDNVKALSSATGFNFTVSAYKDEVALRRLRGAFTILNQLGASADQCLSWTKSVMNETDERKCAQDVKSLVRARLDNDQWLEIAKTLNDPLREKQRAALVSYLMPKRNARNGDELYDDFLVDVEMSPCMMTTRIKQAIGSVQLFIQRSLMNLESDVSLTPKEAREWAQWRKQYRIWEANRKVLLYPENWIEPELRDDKSAFFKELENELLQSEVTMDTAESAFVHYLEKLHDVARLEIVGMYRQQEAEGDVLHVIGRTFSAPHIYYYRRQIDSASWTPWEKVEADIQGHHIIPIVWNRRLYLFWPIFNIKQREAPIKMPSAGATMERGEKMLEIQFSWTEYKNGKWSAKKLASPFLSTLKHPDTPLSDADFKLFSFKSRVQTTSTGERQLFIDWYGPVELSSTTTVTSTTANTVQETFLFSLGAGKFKSVIASVNSRAFKSEDVSKVEIIGKNATTQTVVSRSRLSSSGALDIQNTNTFSVKYFLSSSDYKPENIVVTGQKQICWIDDGRTSPQLVGGNGDLGKSALIDTEMMMPALIGADGSPTPMMISIGGTQVCDIISEALCDFDLVTIPVNSTTSTNTTTSVDPNQAITSFYFDDAQQSVSPLGSNAIFRLEPVVGTRFENMMMVEYQNPNSDGVGDTRILRKTPGLFRLLPLHQSYQAKKLEYPAFFQDDAHSYYITQANSTSTLQFSTFYHPTVGSFFKSLNRSGISGLLTLANQRLIDQAISFDDYLADPAQVDTNSKPREDVNFDYDGAYSLYNWELFFHTPFLVATQLSKNQRFEEAQKWFHYIFDPTATDSPEQPGTPGPERFWRVKPLYEQALNGTQTLEELFANTGALTAQIQEWQANPFKPHVIARLRLVAYMKAVVMHYIDNLIAWGDQLFRRDTIESINEATQLYILAGQILGRRPEQIPPRAKAGVQTFRTLDDVTALNGLANASVEIEGFLSPSVVPPPDDASEGAMPVMPFFGIPGNEKLLSYWNTVADRLFKIRHCLNIEGVVRSLPAFEPPIDPGLLTRAVGAGVDIASALSDINVALPHYRFNVMLQKAAELCGEVKMLGGALLSTLEKRDAEAMALLRSTHEVKVLNAVRAIKEKQIQEAQAARDGLQRTKELTMQRRDYYRDIAYMNAWEIGSMLLTGTSLLLNDVEAKAHALAGTLHLFPNAKIGAPTSLGFTHGGENMGQALKEYGDSVGRVASLMSGGASMASTMGGYQRRFDDWKLQERLANKELEQIEKQILAAEIRNAIAEKDLSNHDLQIENTREVDEFMRSKFTNRELYDWMVGQISGIYFQSYQLAYDVAKRAERAYRYELSVRESSFIQFGYWDSLKKGLLAGERLSYDLKRMEVAYLDQNKREYEIAKHVSLLSIDPVSLVKLKQTGECFVTLPETLFDIDYAGHYMRRIKSVGITVPCVAGPYTGINCTLTLQSSTIRHGNTLSNGKYGRQADDPRFADSAGTVQSIVTSGAQNDSGMFETNLRDERYLPFEGQGAISTWRIEMPKNFKSFDYNTISDVVLHLRYTAREGGAQLKAQAEQELQTALNDFVRIEGKRGLVQMFSLRQEFSTEWSRFLNAPSGTLQSLTMQVTKERFPFLFQGRTIAISSIELYLKVKDALPINVTMAAGATAPAPPNAQPGDILKLDPWNNLFRASKIFNNAPGAFTLNAWRTNGEPVGPNALEDIVVVCRYTCS